MKKFIAMVISLCVLFTFIPSLQAQELYQQMNDAFNRLEVSSLLPGWDIQYATKGKSSITLTCPTLNVKFKEVCAQLYALRNKVVTGNSEDAMSLVIRYLYSSGVSEEYLTTSQAGFGMFFTQQGGLANATYGTTEFFGGSGNTTGRRMDIYLNVNGGFAIDDTDRAYFAKMKELVKEARAVSPYQIEQLDYFVKWLNDNTHYELGTPGGAANLVVNGAGVCEHYANSVQDFCLLVGIPSLYVSNYVQVHSWNYLCIDNLWYEYDATNNRHLGVNKSSLRRVTYGGNRGDVLSKQNLNYIKETILKNGVRVVLDGKSLGFDQQPVIQNGRTLVPLRVIFEAIGANVEWINETQSIVAVKDDITVEMSIGRNECYVNGEEKILDVPPQIINGRTLVPARAVAESFNCSVDWFDQMNTVIINSN